MFRHATQVNTTMRTLRTARIRTNVAASEHGIPSFTEFLISQRGKSKDQNQNQLQRKNQKTRSPSQTQSRQPLTAALLAAKSAPSVSGLLPAELAAINSLLSDNTTPTKRLSNNSISLPGRRDFETPLKIDRSYISQFPRSVAPSKAEVQAANYSRIASIAASTLSKSGNPDPSSNSILNLNSDAALNFADLTVSQITSVIRLNTLVGRVQEAHETFELIKEYSVEKYADTIAINTLMDAYARIGDYRGAAGVFKLFHDGKLQLKEFFIYSYSRNKIQTTPESITKSSPDEISYSTLIKACVAASKLSSAFDVFTAMKNRSIIPPIHVYTTLIKGCLDARDIARAWKTFNHMREEICDPDVQTYSLMIYACALDQNPERALDLFNEMHRHGLIATEVTYTSLLQACGSRRDYYEELWSLAEQMVMAGWKLNTVAAKILLRACGFQSDIVRLRAVWNYFISKAANGIDANDSLVLDVDFYQSMLHGLGKCMRVSRRVKRNSPALSEARSSTETTHNQYKKASISAKDDTKFFIEEESTNETATDIITTEPYVFIEPVYPNHNLAEIHLADSVFSPSSIITDTDKIWTYLVKTIPKKSITTDLLNSYFGVYCGNPNNWVTSKKAMTIYNTAYIPVQPQPAFGTAVEAFKNDQKLAKLSSAETNVRVNQYKQPQVSNVAINITPNQHEQTLSNLSITSVNKISVNDNEQIKTDLTRNSVVTDSENPTSIGHLVPKSAYTYQFALELVSNNKKLMRKYGHQIWSEYMAWDARLEKDLTYVDANSKTKRSITAAQKEEVRVSQGRSNKIVRNMFLMMIKGQTKMNEITPALDTLEAATIFRNDPSYLQPIVFTDVNNLVDKVRDLAENGDLEFTKRLKELCPPPPSKNAYEEVQAMLRNKWSGGKSWWGWEALGIDETIRKSVIRKKMKETKIYVMMAELILAYHKFVQKEKELSQAEETTQLTQLLKSGLGVRTQGITAMRTGLGGKSVAVFALNLNSVTSHALTVGDNVAAVDLNHMNVKPAEDRSPSHGVISKIVSQEIHVAFGDEFAMDSASNIALIKVSSTATFARMEMALENVLSLLDSPPLNSENTIPPTLLSTLMGKSPPVYTPLAKPITFNNKFLNSSQQSAITHCLSSDSVALIHGPPGTGKTETIIELVKQLCNLKQRVLLCAPSNIAVDTLAARLSASLNPSICMTRIGHPSRVRRDEVLSHVLDVRVRSSDEGAIVNDVRAEMDLTFTKIAKTKRKSERRMLYDNLKKLRQELRARERKVIQDILTGSNVVISTLSGCGSFVMTGQIFDAVVIDECSQAIEAESWIAILKGRGRVFFAGDHLQLPPTVKFSGAVVSNYSVMTVAELPASLEYTMFDRLLAAYGDSIKKMLETQYRMHETIMQYSSNYLYDGKLMAHKSVKSHLLADLPNVVETDETTSAITFLNTSMCGYEEHTSAQVDFPSSTSQSKLSYFLCESIQNRGEAFLVETHVKKLVKAGVAISDISVITPYNGQVRLLKSILYPIFLGLEIGTVDSFQGAEKEAIILSLVRSNEKREIGFLGDFRRLNVAVTRARRHLCVIFDERMAKSSKFLTGFCKFIEENADMVYVE
ncbi:hypothetical protein HK100_011456 [Physocladia obscura]|uniref:DNA helicase n=1 Tax=Physocladia obscura TaxID=109957 RepID=A0AAD5XGL4_9FUNG|nr:hypothetical protein HK100_011456 [Physocladia obscura]